MDSLSDSALYRNTMRSLDTAGKIAKVCPATLTTLRSPRRAIIVSVPVKMDDNTMNVYTGYRVQHNQTLGPFKGGIRFHPNVTLSEVTALSALMTFKNSLLNLPLGGAKGGVAVDPAVLSPTELELLTRRFTREIAPFIGHDKDIPAPDVGTNAQTMAWMLDTFSMDVGYAQTGVVTGKPIEIGGSQGRDSATGLGVVYTIEKALESIGSNIQGATIAIQGFGKVGLHVANEANKLGAKIVAVSDMNGAIYNGEGLNVDELLQYSAENETVVGFPGCETITNAELLALEVDVVAPCALDGVINSTNVSTIKCKCIVEGANGPVTINASEELEAKGILIVPDILANGGGVVVSYFEWVQDIVWLFWNEDEVRNKLRTIMYRSFDFVHENARKHDINLRTSAMVVSVSRLEKAMKLRGQIW